MSILIKAIINSKCSQLKCYGYLRPILSQNHANSLKVTKSLVKKDFSRFPYNEFQSDYALGRLWKPLGFALVFSGASVTGAAIWHQRGRRTSSRRSRRSRQNQQESWISEGNKIFAPICVANTLVWLAWRVPGWQPTMIKYFISSLSSKTLCWPMILSVFSHTDFLHLAVNMFVLHNFAEAAVNSLGKEQLLAMYLSAGVFSSLASYLYKAVIKRPIGSLGASGAVACLMAYTCMRYPDARMGIVLLPMITFPASAALKGFLVFEGVGCALQWSVFDHAAHLGGALFGIFWYQWGQKYVWRKMDALVSSRRKL